jgi:bifunctional DNA-binding transcriptional regulator/antitoxin component of YhaV-PrlF toxin-antitoxin module
MFREFETTIIDDQGHFDMPRDLRERKGLKKGARLKIEERNSELIITPAESEEERKKRQKAAIRSAIGIVPPDSKVLEHLLEERRNEREQEDRPAGL